MQHGEIEDFDRDRPDGEARPERLKSRRYPDERAPDACSPTDTGA